VTEAREKVLLLYSTCDGQTRAITEAVAEHLAGAFPVDVVDIVDFNPAELPAYRAVFIGAGLRYGMFNKRVKRFTRRHAAALNAVPSAFAGVCLIARKPHKRSVVTNVYLRKFFRDHPWHPQILTGVAGALLYPRYTWYDRLAIRLIMTITGGETDTTKEIVYTDWEQVRQIAREFQELVEKNTRGLTG
jgi:menaquinone-dependent protoporphyrinogen oxidase